MFWVGNQGEGTSPCCTLFFSDFRTSFSFSLWLGGWDHFTRRTETFQRYQTCMVTYLYILHCMDFSVNSRWWGEGEMMRPSVQGVDPPVCCTPGCYCYICKRQLCGFPQCAASWMTYARDSFVDSQGGLLSSRGGGPDTLAQTHWHQSYTINVVSQPKIVWLTYNQLSIHPRLRVLSQLHLYCQICGWYCGSGPHQQRWRGRILGWGGETYIMVPGQLSLSEREQN